MWHAHFATGIMSTSILMHLLHPSKQTLKNLCYHLGYPCYDWWLKIFSHNLFGCHYGLVIYIREYLKATKIYGNSNISPYKNIIFKKNPFKKTKFLQDITTLSLIPSFNISQNIIFQKSSSRPIGSKQHITSQCVYFAFRTIIFFGVLFPKKHVFLKRNFQMKCFETFIYRIYSCLNMLYVFLQSNLEKYKFLKLHKFC
jgi:hypothetical protein